MLGSVFSFEKEESSTESIKGIRITDRERGRALLFQYLSLFVEREKEKEIESRKREKQWRTNNKEISTNSITHFSLLTNNNSNRGSPLWWP